MTGKEFSVFVTILACIFVFGVLISIHEFGHFITAKLTDMRVDEFAIGFGPEIWQKQKGETLYSLRLLPLGGYNRIAGMDPDDPPDLDRGFNSKSVWARMFVILAGSLMNLLLPVFIFFVLFIVSGVNLPVNEPVIGEVVPGYAAAATGMQKGDRILTINGRAVEDWTGVREQIAAAGTQPTQIVIERNGARQTLTMTPAVNPDTGRPFIGVVSSLGADVRFFRAAILDEIYRPYVLAARAKGLPGSVILVRHVLRNALVPIVTYVSLSIPHLFTGSLLLESFFGIPGLGSVAINAIHSSDMAVVRAVVVIGALLYQFVNLATDLLYAALDPRVTVG